MYYAALLIALLLFIYGVYTIIILLMSLPDIGTYIYGNALTLFLFTGLPAIIIGLIVAVRAYKRR
jgi:hypothetical protein